MACNLTKGFSISCRDGIGGVRMIYIGQFSEITLTTSAGEVTDIEMGTNSLHRYQPKRGVASISESVNASSENGTVFYTHTCNFKFNKLTSEYQNELKLLAQQRVLIFAELNELTAGGKNIIMCLGATNGLEMSAGTNASGTALGDMNGYDWTFEGIDSNPMLEVADYTSIPFDNSAFTMGAHVTS